MSRKAYNKWGSVWFKPQGKICPWAIIGNDKLAQDCLFSLICGMFKKDIFGDYTYEKTLAGKLGYQNISRIREKLIKLERLGFIYQKNSQYFLKRKYRVLEEGSYYFLTESILEWLFTQNKTNRAVFLYLATIESSIRQSQETGIYSVAYVKRNSKPWELLGTTRKGWYVSLNDLEEQGKVRLVRGLGNSIVNIEILIEKECIR